MGGCKLEGYSSAQERTNAMPQSVSGLPLRAQSVGSIENSWVTSKQSNFHAPQGLQSPVTFPLPLCYSPERRDTLPLNPLLCPVTGGVVRNPFLAVLTCHRGQCTGQWTVWQVRQTLNPSSFPMLLTKLCREISHLLLSSACQGPSVMLSSSLQR